MKVVDVQQGTSAWLQARAGIPTASQMDRLITPGGEISKSAETYLYELIAERILGRPIEQHVSLYMARGSQMEAEALAYYEFQSGRKVQPVGFVLTDDGRVGASPDGLIDADGCLELKCPNAATHCQYLFQSGGAYKIYKVQCQVQLYVTERDFTDVVSYYPGLPEAIIRIVRDEEYIAKIKAASSAFCDQLDAKWEECKQRGYGMARPTKEDSRFSHLPALEQLLKLAGTP